MKPQKATSESIKNLKSEIFARTGIKINGRLGSGSYSNFMCISLPKEMYAGDAYSTKKEERIHQWKRISEQLNKLNVFVSSGIKYEAVSEKYCIQMGSIAIHVRELI